MQNKENNRPDWFEGAASAYEDCAKMVDSLADGLPDDIKFMDAGIRLIAEGIRGKIKDMDLLLAMEAGHS